MREATLLVQRCIRRLQEEGSGSSSSSESSSGSSPAASPPPSLAGPSMAISNRRVGHASSRGEAILEIKLDRPVAASSVSADAASSAAASSSSVLVWSGAQSQFHAPLSSQLEEDIFKQLKAIING